MSKMKIMLQVSLLLICIKPMNTVPCNIFPKLFGGSAGNTFLAQIDVYGDYLAMGGRTYDSGLTGYTFNTCCVPYVAMMQLSTTEVFYWAKSFQQKDSYLIAGVVFSTDGTLLLTHGYGPIGFITVFNAFSGAVISARAYSSDSYFNYNYPFKSMVAGSGTSAKAYVLSNYGTSTMFISQHLIAFDPLTSPTTAPIWAKMSLANGGGNLGLTFGRGELLLYAFSWYNNMATISLLDIAGNSKWQFSAPDGSSWQNNLIQYRALDLATDMVIATSGSTIINYNVIISSSATPYSIQSGSQTYRDPTSSTTRQIRALYIVSLTSARSLIWDTLSHLTDYASLDFSTPQITYKKSLAYMGMEVLGIFVSDTLYYAGAYQQRVYQGQSAYPMEWIDQLNYRNHAIVYSSNPTQSSCYSYSSDPEQPPIIMSTLSLTSIATTLYKTSLVTFVVDTDASTTVDIVQTKITKLDPAWCDQSGGGIVTVNPVTQGTTNFNVLQNTAASLPITPFSATVNCGTLTNTWSYKGIDMSNGLLLNPSLDLMTVDPNSGTIQVQQGKPNGTYHIKIVGTLPDLMTTYSQVFQIILAQNSPPFFTDKLPQNLEMILNTIFAYTLPEFADPEGYPVVVSFLPTQLSSFVTVNKNQIVFAPNQQYQTGDFDITVILKDPQGFSTNSTFIITIHQPPLFINKVVKLINLMASKETLYSLPVDREMQDEYIVHKISLPRFAVFNFPDYTFLPDRKSDLGVYIIQGNLWNAHAYVSFQFQVNVTNEAPQFSGLYLSDPILIKLNTIELYRLPTVSDREGQPLTYFTYESKKNSLPEFVKFDSASLVYTIAPTLLESFGEYKIIAEAIDSFGACTSYSFNFKVLDPTQVALSKQSFQSFNGTKQKQNEYQILQVKFILKKITKQQEATLKILAPESVNTADLSRLVILLTSKSFEFSVCPNNIQCYQIPQDISSKDISQSTIKFKLNYPDLRNISISQIPDTLRIVKKNRIQMLQSRTQLVMLENSFAEGFIPSQIIEKSQKSIAASFRENRITITDITLLDILIGYSIQVVWLQLEDTSFLTINSFISVQIPGIPSIIMSVLLKLIYFDIFYTERWLPHMLQNIGIDIDQVDNDIPISLSFQESGFSSKQFLKNAGSTLLFLFLYIIGWLVLVALQRVSINFPQFIPIKIILERWLKWNLSINLLQSQFTPLILSSMINFYDVIILALLILQARFQNDHKVSHISIICSIAVMAVTTASLVAIFIQLRSLSKNYDEQKVKQFNEKYSPLTENLKQNSKSTFIIYWKAILMVRWFITLVILLILSKQPAIQMVLLLVLSVIQQIMIVKLQPFDSKLTNAMTLFNEVGVSVYLYLALMISDYMESQFTQSDLQMNNRLKISWTITILFCVVIGVNFFAFIIQQIIAISSCLRKRKKRLRRNEDKVVAFRPLPKQIDQKKDISKFITTVDKSQADQIERDAEEYKQYFTMKKNQRFDKSSPLKF